MRRLDEYPEIENRMTEADLLHAYGLDLQPAPQEAGTEPANAQDVAGRASGEPTPAGPGDTPIG